MKINKAAFRKLFDFIKQFPHYSLGSNVDLLIVEEFILSRDHFQGGHYTFAMAKAPIKKYFTIKGYEDVEMGIVFWPTFMLRLQAVDPDRLIELGDIVLEAWRSHMDEDVFIFAETDGEPHSTVTSIARKVRDTSKLDLVPHNNITIEEFPLGVYHSHQELHRAKKGNIGLIKVVGLIVPPSRFKAGLTMPGEYMVDGRDIRRNEVLEKYVDWVEEFLPVYQEKSTPVTRNNMWSILQEGVGKVFTRVLEDASVYRHDGQGRRALARFLHFVDFEEV